MKYLYLIRHAKAKPEEEGSSDFERKLTDRGKADSLNMGLHLRIKECPIDKFLCSPAKRAAKTCRLLASGMEADENIIQYENELYLANSETIENIINRYGGPEGSLAVVCHNPGITDYANSLCESVQIDNMPTGSVFAVKTDIESWDQFGHAKKEFLFFLQPRLSGL